MSRARMGEIYRLALLVTVMAMSCAGVHATSLGMIDVQSRLGQPLRARIPLLGTEGQDQANRCISGRVESMDGVLLARLKIELLRPGSSPFLQLVTSEALNEPVLTVFVALRCGVSMQRSFQVLLDPVMVANEEPKQRQAVAMPLQRPFVHAFPPAAVAPVSPGLAEEKMQAASSPELAKVRGNAEKPAKKAVAKPQEKSRPKAQAKAGNAPRNVLRLSAADDADERAGSVLRLRLSDTLAALPSEAQLRTPEQILAEQALLAAAADEEEITHRARMLVHAMQSEVEVLKSEIKAMQMENERVKQQGLMEKAAMEAARNASLYWTIGLGILILVCLAAIMWLMWRFLAMQKSALQIPWNELDTVQDLSTVQDSEFPISRFDNTFFDASTIKGATAEQRRDSLPPATAKNDIAAAAGASVERAANPDAGENKPVGGRRGAGKPAPAAASEAQAAQALKAEEISDIMELVAAWTALNDPHKVLELLKPFSDVEQPQSPLPWLCLLDVYRALGDCEKYEVILERIRKLFNVKLAPWDASEEQEAVRSLADYPHVVEQVVALWKGEEIKPYLENLLRDNREGMRKGFDLPVYRDILSLIALIEDPGCDRFDEVIDPRVYAILFGPPKPRSKPAFSARPEANGEDAGSVGNRIRERPKYITPSYQRTLLERSDEEREELSAVADGGKVSEVPVFEENEQAATDPAEISEMTREAIRAAAARDEIPNGTGRQPSDPEQERMPAKPEASVGAEDCNAATEQDDMSPMTVKLHLAIAYRHIGDKEGASLLLEEVIEEGSPEQSEQARLILKELA